MRPGAGSLHLWSVFKLCRVLCGQEYAVYHPFFSSLMLAVEAQRVIDLRLVRLAWGGREGLAEARSMVIEKVQAASEAMTTLMLGGSPETVIARYREHVAANTKRLLGAWVRIARGLSREGSAQAASRGSDIHCGLGEYAACATSTA